MLPAQSQACRSRAATSLCPSVVADLRSAWVRGCSDLWSDIVPGASVKASLGETVRPSKPTALRRAGGGLARGTDVCVLPVSPESCFHGHPEGVSTSPELVLPCVLREEGICLAWTPGPVQMKTSCCHLVSLRVLRP